MIARIVMAVVVGVATVLACLLIGALLTALHIEFAVVVGAFLTKWSGVIGLLAALGYWASGSGWAPWRRPPTA